MLKKYKRIIHKKLKKLNLLDSLVEHPIKENISVFEFIFLFVKFRKKQFFIWLSLSLSEVLNSVLTPFIISYLVSGIEAATRNSQNVSHFIFQGICEFLLFILILEVMHAVGDFIEANYLDPNMRYNMKSFLFKRVLNKNIDFFSNIDSGEIVTKVNSLVEECMSFVGQAVNFFIPNIISGFLFVCSFFYIDYRLGLCVLIGTIAQAINIMFLGSFSKKCSMSSFKTTSLLTNNFVDIIRNIKTIKFAHSNKREEMRFARWNLRDLIRYRKQLFSLLLLNTLMSIIFFGMCVVFFYILYKLYGQHKINIGNISFCFLSISNYLSLLFYISSDFNILLTRHGICQEAMSIVNNDNILDIRSNSIETDGNFQSIEFKNVNFSYGQHSIIQNVSLKINKGDRIGIVGPSGSGKTTILNLLTKQILPSEGQIKFNNTDYKDINTKSLLNKICVIHQNASLFNRSVAENISYLKPEAKKSDIIEAAKLAGAHTFISKLKNGYNTILNDSMGISGGQKQRIVLARAILHDADILILDESTAFLDSKTEEFVNKSIREVFKNKTLIVVAHKLKNVSDLERIVVFEYGKIIEEGSHDELMNKKSLYYNMMFG